MKKLIVASLAFALFIGTAQAQSTIDPTQPATDASLTSAPVRNNFLAAYNDINRLFTLIPGAGSSPANSMIGNWTSVASVAASNIMPSCPDVSPNHLNYVNGTGVTCGTSSAGITALTGNVTGSGTGSVTTTIAAGVVTTAMMSTIAANSVLANWTNGTAAVLAKTFPSCPDSGGQHLNYVNGTGLTCGSTNSGGSSPVNTGTTGGIAYYNTTTTISSSGVIGTGNPIVGGNVGAPTSGTRTGSTTLFATANGVPVSGNCASWSSGNIVDAGGPCTTGGGGGTVSGGVANQLAYYATSSNTIVGLNTANNAVLVTNGTGVPSESTTLPSALTIPSPTISGTVAGANTHPFSTLAQLAALSVLGNCSNVTANVGAVTGAANQVLVVNSGSTACGFGQVNLSSGAAVTGALQAAQFPVLTGDVTTPGNSLATTIAANAVTNAKAAQATPNTWKGNQTNSTGNVSDNAWANCFGTNSALTYTAGIGVGCNSAIASLSAANQTIAGGANVTSLTQTAGNITVNCGLRPLQFMAGSSSTWTITAPANDGSCILLVTNPGSAVVPTFSGFAEGTNTGDTFTTNGSAQFSIHIWRINGVAGYRIAAHQ